MDLTLIGHDDRYAVEQLQLSLFPQGQPGQAVSTLHRGKTWLTASTQITLDGKTVQASRRIPAAEETVRLRRRALQQSYYLAACQLLPVLPPWGALAGVRPTKLTTKHLLEGGTPRSADKMLKDVYYVTESRRKLAVDCSVSTVRAARLLQPQDLSVYIGIPFCPSRCAYCSFVSRTIGKKTELLEPYLEALLSEIRLTGELLRASGKTIRSLYIGGGTPTTLSTPQMIRLLDAINQSFDLSRCLEFTVEGGRPDTLDEEKLRAIHDRGVNRMSINPQTMEDSVLRCCGRIHKTQDILRACDQATAAHRHPGGLPPFSGCGGPAEPLQHHRPYPGPEKRGGSVRASGKPAFRRSGGGNGCLCRSHPAEPGLQALLPVPPEIYVRQF